MSFKKKSTLLFMLFKIPTVMGYEMGFTCLGLFVLIKYYLMAVT